MTGDRPLASIGWNFAAGMIAGLTVAVGSKITGATLVTALVDRMGDGIGLVDAALVGGLGGGVAILVHHVMPAIAWR